MVHGLLALGLCLAAFLGAAVVSTGVFDRLPHLEDEVAFLFQARTIASGRLLAEAPALPQFFDIPFVIVREGQWFGKYPPGYPVVLALGVLVGQPWLLNPLFGALSVGLIYLAGRRFYGAQTGLLAAGLAGVSPFFLLQAGSLMSHTVSLFWALTFLLLFDTARRRLSRAAALAAGSALGMLFLSRPLTAAGVAIPYVLWAAFDIIRGRRVWPQYLAMAMGLLPFLGGLLFYNHLTTGDALRSAYEIWWPYDKVGFGPGIGIGENHTLEEGWFNTGLTLDALADYLFGWPGRLSLLPALLATGLAATRLAWRAFQRMGRGDQVPEDRGVALEAASSQGWDLLQAGLAASLVAVHMAYWVPGLVYGPRYYFEALGALALLSARGLLQTAQGAAVLLGWMFPRGRHLQAWATSITLMAVAALVLHSLSNFLPQEFTRYTRWYGIDGEGLRRVQEAGLRKAVVFVERASWTDYAPFFSQNPPSLDSEVLYAVDLGANNQDLRALYPERAFFRYSQGQLTPVRAP